MPNPFYATVTTPGFTVCMPDYRQAVFNVGVQVFVPVGTTVVYEVDYSLDDPNLNYSTPLPPQEWLPLTSFPAGSTSNASAAVQMPVTGLRLNVASISGGPVFFKVIQGDFIGT
jgi:hypothetical protein